MRRLSMSVTAKRVVACVLALLLVVGLVPVLLEAPYALADEVEPVLELTNEDVAEDRDSDFNIVLDNDEKMPDEDLEVITQGSSGEEGTGWVRNRVSTMDSAQDLNTSDHSVARVKSIEPNATPDPRLKSDNILSLNDLSSTSITVGDRLIMGEYQGQAITWVCVAINNRGPLMLSERSLCCKAFDSNGEDDTYHTDGWGYIRKSYGSNCWSDSSLRQWLNATGSVDWTHCAPTAQHVKDGLNAYDSEDGFLTGFTQEELAHIKSVSRVVNVNSWEKSRVGYVDGGTSKITYNTIEDCNRDDEQRQKFYYQMVEDRIFLLGPDEVYVAWQNTPDTLLLEHEQWWLGIAQNTGASYENVTTFDPEANSTNSATGYANAYDGSVGVRPAFYLDARHFCNGYNAKRDKLYFRNENRKIPLEYFTSVFRPSTALLLWTKFGHGEAKGVCYGMANATYSLLNHSPSINDMRTATFVDGVLVDNQTIDRLSRIRGDDITSGSQTFSASFIRAGLRAVPFIDFIRYNHIYQASPTAVVSELVNNDVSLIFDKVKYEIDTNKLGSLILFDKGLFSNKKHAVLPVGYSETVDERTIIIDDSNDINNLHEIKIRADGSWSYDYDDYSSEDTNMKWCIASTMPYEILSYDIRPHTSWGWRLWNNLSQLVDIIESESMDTGKLPLDKDYYMVGVKSEGYEISCSGDATPQRIEDYGIVDYNEDDRGDFFWVSNESSVSFSNLHGQESEVVVAEGTNIVTTTVVDGSSVDVETTDVGNKTSIKSSGGSIVNVEIQNVAADTKVSTLSIVGTLSDDSASFNIGENGYVVDGLRDATFTLTNDNGTDEVTVANEGGGAIDVSVNEPNAEISIPIIAASKPRSIASATVALGATNYTYDGTAKSPGVKSVVLGDITLKEGADYSVSAPSSCTHAGTYTYTVTGKGAYTGAASASFTINKAASSITIVAQSKVYTGKVRAYSGKVTKAGSTGKVTYAYFSNAKGTKSVKASAVKRAATYYVRATLSADTNHEAARSALVKYTITKAANPMRVKAVKRAAKASKAKSKAQVVDRPLKFTKKAQGKVTYKKAGGSKYLSVSKTTGKVTVKKGTEKGTYKVKIKVTAAGNANYKKASKTVTCAVVVK